MSNTLSRGIEILMVITGVVVLLSFGVAVIIFVLSAWISIRCVSRLPIKNIVLGVVEETQVSNRFTAGIGIVSFLILETLPKVVTGSMPYIAGGFLLLGLIITTIFIVAGPKVSMLPELDFMTLLSAGAMGVLVILTGFVVPIAKSKKMKLVGEIEFKQPEDLKMEPIISNIVTGGKNVVKDFKTGETTTRVLKNVSLKALKGEFISTTGQSGFDDKKFKDYRKQLDNILEIAGLSDRRRYTPRELSGGQRQRAVIACALISNPEILFADEPMGNLDSKTGTEIMRLLQSINKNSEQTTIMVTHSPEAAKNSNRIITVKDGMIEQLYMT